MTPLFFHAVAGHPTVASALMDQARTTLRPFQRYLRQAMHTARERQVRYQLPWEPVRDVATVRLEPLDTVIFVPRRPPGMVLYPWPPEATPDPSKPGFVINRSVVVVIESVRSVARGLLVHTTPPLEPHDQLMWCERVHDVEPEVASEAPSSFARLDGRTLHLQGVPEAVGEHWRVCLEGSIADEHLRVDGDALAVRRAHEGPRRLLDAAGSAFTATGMVLRTEELPAEGLLQGDDGVRYAWSHIDGTGRRGAWVQLLPPDGTGADDFLDPRAAFCEGDVREVWTAPQHRKDAVLAVKRVDADRYQLLLERRPEGPTLYLPVDVRNLELQRRALHQLAEAPLPHHRGLLRLCEDPARVRWPAVAAVALDESRWRSLIDPTRSGTDEQRRFVAQALGSPDFAFLEGPPGSGKTTAICELVQQLVEQGQRVLLCASTHVAVDNVLERLLATASPIDAVRIGHRERVDDAVYETQLDARVERLVSQWREVPAMRAYGDQERLAMAERTIIMAANLTCGTTMGIVNHPLFRGRDEDLRAWERPISTMPHWDVLIVDEASKTLIQEFLVPALMARRWIIVGDVRQLPPFSDRADLVANLRDLVDQEDRSIFPREHQRACLLLFRLLRGRVRQAGMRWLVVEPPSVLDWIERELAAAPAEVLSVVRVVSRARAGDGPVALVTVEQLRAGEAAALRLAAADWVLVADELLPHVSRWLPSSLLLTRDPTAGPKALAESDALLLRQHHWLVRAGRLPQPYRDERTRGDQVRTFEDGEGNEREWLARHDLAGELAWRVTRIHELRRGRNHRDRERLRDEIAALTPRVADIAEPLAELEDIGLPSILEVLQEGIGADRSQRPSALTLGFRTTRTREFEARFASLSYQHRMHPEISGFAREVFYGGQSLRDANTIAQRDASLGWSFGRLPARRVWWHVAGREHQGVNAEEVQVIEAQIREFVAWAREAGPPGPPGSRPPRRWELACLAFYVKQERALAQMLQRVTGDHSGRTRFVVADAPVEVVCGTVDRFQGREADLVLLSLRNTARVGFLDSPNRLNVAVTRARQQLTVVGHAVHFGGCGIAELEALVRQSHQALPLPRSGERRRR